LAQLYLNAPTGSDAHAAYTACHAVALDLAAAGRGNEAALKDAYFMDAWGLHFLTDAFSSGHLRVPRRALHDDNFARAGAGMCSNGWTVVLQLIFCRRGC
jgi:hypothetical protein